MSRTLLSFIWKHLKFEFMTSIFIPMYESWSKLVLYFYQWRMVLKAIWGFELYKHYPQKGTMGNLDIINTYNYTILASSFFKLFLTTWTFEDRCSLWSSTSFIKARSCSLYNALNRFFTRNSPLSSWILLSFSSYTKH